MARSRLLTVKILTDAAGAQKGLSAASAQYSKFTRSLGRTSATAGTKAGDYLVSGIDKVLGTGLKIVGGAGAAILGTALFRGFQRLKDIDNATASLRGLGHSTEAVEKIMKNARAAVDDTKYALGDMAGVAGTMVAAGVKPSQELERTLKGVADSAFIGKSSIGEMGQIWGKVAARNRISGQEVNQLLQRQIPILKLLGDHYGVTADQASKMVSRGEVDFAAFSAAMNKGVGGAALQSGKTWEGAWDNTMAALGRIGAAILEPLFGKITGGLNATKNLFKSLEEPAARLGQVFADMLDWVQRNSTLLLNLGKAAAVAIGLLLGFRTVVAIMQAYQAVMAVVRVAQAAYTAASYGAVGASYAQVAATTAQKIAFIGAVAAQKASTAAQWIWTTAIKGGTLALGSSLAAMGSWIAFQARAIASTAALVAKLVVMKTVQLGSVIATKAAAAAQWLLNAAMTANPIGLIIAAIVALIAVIVLIATKTRWFQQIWAVVWGAVKTAAAAVWNWLKAAGQAVMQALIAYVRLILSPYVAVFNGIKTVVASVFNWIRTGGPAQALSWLRSAAATVAGPFVTAFNAIKTGGGAAFNGLLAVARTVLNGILAPIRGIQSAFNAVVSAIRSVVDWIGRLRFPSPPSWLTGLFGRALPTGAQLAPAGLSRGLSATAAIPTWSPVPNLAALTGGVTRGGDIISIEVTGALDPDAVARQIRSLLTGRDRRTAGVTIDRRVR